MNNICNNAHQPVSRKQVGGSVCPDLPGCDLPLADSICADVRFGFDDLA